MSATQSYLSENDYEVKYGYDFVVATTQASINTGLLEYLHAVPETETILCYLADAAGNPTVLIALPALLALTGNVNPFDLPDNTYINDPRLQALIHPVGFRVGLRLKMGLPPGVMPNALPPVVTLGTSADQVQFNTLCSELQIVQYDPNTTVWHSWSQPAGQSWHFGSTVDLVNADLDKELNTPYFNSHPDERAALLAQLENLSATAFSLQQLTFDLDSAALEATPQIAGLDPDAPAAAVLKNVFIGTYFAQVKQNGSPVLSVHAVSSTPDASSLQLTSLERQIGLPVDITGQVIPNPTPEQVQATTLAFLCAANNNPLPPARSFVWNWVDPAEVDSISGVIAINRNTLAAYYKNKLLPLVSQSCIRTQMHVVPHSDQSIDYLFQLTPGDTPQNTLITTPGDPTVLTISYESVAGDHAYTAFGAAMVEFNMHNYYTCTVSFSGNTITIVQNLRVYVFIRYSSDTVSGNVIDRTITDTYVLSVGVNGNITTTATTATQDNSYSPQNFDPVLQAANDPRVVWEIAGYASRIVSVGLKSIPAQDIQSFVFPGGKVFTYKDVRFSDHQDLVSSVTYVAPGPAAATPHRTGVPVL